ncbi:CaiB/BaiF CoA-transferase family protein [Mycobacterium sp. 1423905.2]|uniref:CaiB/BaiF CoA transferase family protein n=1 Tax=Mycobacterium sp. 1423905.2 TaxID=1856859 RepID=UPI0007FCAB2F|nr:CoA transferase [Mycobacterium sp. 1423905.2]OBJ48952.1 acyl-CoA transferase [Mycobacterium sp. 1423905.2]
MTDGLLDAVCVLDLSCGDADSVTRLLADLGADVLKIEPKGGCPTRAALPTVAGSSIAFTLHNANKRSAVLEPGNAEDRRRFFDLAATADIVVDCGLPGRAATYGTSCAELADRYEHLIALSVTDFGMTGPRSSWRATDPVLYAMSGALSRSGPSIGTPVLPPEGIASATAAVQATWAVLLAYYHRLRSGRGDFIDFSRFDAVVMALDPPFGAHGQVAAGSTATEPWRGRPQNQDAYPIYPCRDGYVRLCVMAPRQWRALRGWLGEPQQFQDPKYELIGERLAAWPRISGLVETLFVDQTMKDLVVAGQARGVPIAAVLTPSRILASEHFAAVDAITDITLAPGVTVTAPTGYFVVDGQRCGLRQAPPAPGHDESAWRSQPAPTPRPGPPSDYPLHGLRILDLGIIVAGGEVGRLFGDMGAEVIKIESADYPDGLRQARVGDAMSDSFARTHRNQLGLGLNLRNDEGKKIFARLVAEADAVFTNFKPGTLTALGFSYETLRALNPRIVLAGSSAYGHHGPWTNRLGYGPLVRAATGVTRLWTSDEAPQDAARHAFYDATTIFPDHVVGRITAIGALAALIRRESSASGANVHVSQAEAVVNQLDTLFVTEAARAGGIDDIRADTSVHAVYPCAGDDEWCVISIRSDDDWRLATNVFGEPEWAADERFATGAARVSYRRNLVAAVSTWTQTRTPVQAATVLQAAGVPAGPMNRPADLRSDPQLLERTVLRDLVHPLIQRPLPAETGPAPFRHIPPAPQRPAPLPGEHTRQICRDLLGMTGEEIERLIADRALFVPADNT